MTAPPRRSTLIPLLLAFALATGVTPTPVQPVDQDVNHIKAPESIPGYVAVDDGIDNPLDGVFIVPPPGGARRENHAAAVVVSTTLLVDNPQVVDISWKATDPEEGDLLAVAVPVDPDVGDFRVLQYTKATKSDTHLSEGTGTIKMAIANHRADVKVLYLVNAGDDSFFLVGESKLIKVENPEQPLRIHIALTDKKGEMSVQWSTKSQGNPVVKWGSKSGNYTKTAHAESITYRSDELCGHPAKGRGYINPGMLHKAVMTDLKAGRTYYYIVGDEEFGFSEEISLKAPGKVGPDTTLKIAMAADMGQTVEPATDAHDNPNSLYTAEKIGKEKDLDLILHIGDISYAQGYVGDWDRFFDQWGSVIAKVPYMTSPGNHERDWPFSGDRYDSNYNSGGECGIAYERHLRMPQAGVDKPWYSFEMGPVHFLTFSVEHEFAPGTEQYRFLEKDLASVDRSVTPWVVLAMHRPMYISIPESTRWGSYYRVSIELQEHLEALVMKHKVDMLWSGHHHSFHRSCPVFKGKCVGTTSQSNVALAPIYYVFGTAGAWLYTNVIDTPFSEAGFWKHGYMRATASGTSFLMELVDNKDGSILDSHTLEKPEGWEAEWDEFWKTAKVT